MGVDSEFLSLSPVYVDIFAAVVLENRTRFWRVSPILSPLRTALNGGTGRTFMSTTYFRPYTNTSASPL